MSSKDPDESAAAVYCSHVLEHLPRDELSTALRNTFRMMVPGGVFRLVVPDLEWRVREYVTQRQNGRRDAADAFIEGLGVGRRQSPQGALGWLRGYFGRSVHLWMYDFAQLEDLLREAGFQDVRRCQLGDAGDQMFAHVEERGRFLDGPHPELAIEAIKPRLASSAEAAAH